jgi:hypothetical protein
VTVTARVFAAFFFVRVKVFKSAETVRVKGESPSCCRNEISLWKWSDAQGRAVPERSNYVSVTIVSRRRMGVVRRDGRVGRSGNRSRNILFTPLIRIKGSSPPNLS